MTISPEVNQVKYTPLIIADTEKEDFALVLGSFIKPFIKDLMVDIVDIIERADGNKDEITFYFSGSPKFNEDGTVYFNENNLNN